MQGTTPTTSTSSATLLEVDGVHAAYGSVPVLFGISFTLGRGEVLGLLGTNGAGKSTVLRVVAGLLAPTAGTVRLDGRDLRGRPAEARCRDGLALVLGGQAVFRDLTVRENLALGGHLLDRDELDRRTERELDRFPRLRERLGHQAGTLSGGEQQQLAVAKALLLDPQLLCVDELSLGLAPTVVADLLAIVRDVNAAGVSCLVVEQSLNLAAQLCTRALFLEKGRVRFEGHPQELVARGDLARAVFLGGEAPAPRRRARR